MDGTHSEWGGIGIHSTWIAVILLIGFDGRLVAVQRHKDKEGNVVAESEINLWELMAATPSLSKPETLSGSLTVDFILFTLSYKDT